MVKQEDQATHLSDENVTCRTIAHSWVPYTVQVMKHQGTKARTYYVTLSCDRCGAAKSFTVNERGDVVKRHGYVYEKGYLVPGGLSVEDKRQVTLAFIELFSR